MNEREMQDIYYDKIDNMSELQIELWRQTPEYVLELLKYSWLDDLIKKILDMRTFNYMQQNYKIEKLNCLSHWCVTDITPEQLAEPHPFGDVKYMAYDDRDYEDTRVLSLMSGNTWFDLWITASLILNHEFPGDHSFIEGFSKDADNPNCIWLYTGS
jgi:hypothetical protein